MPVVFKNNGKILFEDGEHISFADNPCDCCFFCPCLAGGGSIIYEFVGSGTEIGECCPLGGSASYVLDWNPVTGRYEYNDGSVHLRITLGTLGGSTCAYTLELIAAPPGWCGGGSGFGTDILNCSGGNPLKQWVASSSTRDCHWVHTLYGIVA